METILITDTHYNEENSHAVDDVFLQCFKLAVATKTKSVFHLGDWFTSRTGQTLQTLMAVMKILQQASKFGITIHTIAGNHDKTDLEDERSFLGVFQNHPSLKLYQQHGIVELNKSISLCLLPYFLENGSYLERLEDLIKNAEDNNSKTKKFLLTHTTLNGATNNDGTKQSNNLTRDAFKYFDWVLSGHFHNRNSPWSRAQYIGSSRAANFGEDNDKGFTIINSDGSMKFVRSVFQQYHQFFFNLDSIDEDGFICDFEEASKLAMENHRVRAVVSGSKEMLEMFDKKLFTDNGIEYVPKDSNISKSIMDLEENMFSSFSVQEIKKIFIEYCKINNIKGNALALGLKLMKNL